MEEEDSWRRRMSGHICEDGEADVAVGVDVLVQRDGVADERHLWGVERILHPELELQHKLLPVVQGGGGAAHLDPPEPQVLGLALVQLEALRRVGHEAAHLLLEALECGSGDGGLSGRVRHGGA